MVMDLEDILKAIARACPLAVIGFMWAKLNWPVWLLMILAIVLVLLSVWGNER